MSTYASYLSSWFSSSEKIETPVLNHTLLEISNVRANLKKVDKHKEVIKEVIEENNSSPEVPFRFSINRRELRNAKRHFNKVERARILPADWDTRTDFAKQLANATSSTKRNLNIEANTRYFNEKYPIRYLIRQMSSPNIRFTKRRRLR